jgi:two-component system, chemotaxis family, chemotaxis protein CheY
LAFRILIVDDSPAMRAFVRRVLELSGFETGGCLEAADGNEALRVLESEWVDVVLTDINMPGMNGEELVATLDARELTRTLPVIVISTDATEARVQRMLSLGARGYVRKPFHPEELRTELERVLGVPDAAV